jgi:chemotaxis protein histidine kinase CheA
VSKFKDSINAIRTSLKQPDINAAQAGLEKVQASAADAGSRDAAQLSAMLLSLLEIVSCFGNSKDDQARTGEIVSFVDHSLNTLQTCLNGSEDSGAQETINVANSEWGEYLELLPASGNDAWADNWGGAGLDSKPDTFDASSVDMSALLAGLGEPVFTEPTKPRKENKKRVPSRSKAMSAEPNPVTIPDPPAPEKPEMDADIVEAYADDATSCLASMEQCLLTIESDPSDVASMQQFCRELHTLKGASGSVGLSNLAGYLHRLEDYIEATHKSGGVLDVDPVLRGVDAVRDQLTIVTGGSLPDVAPVAAAVTMSTTDSMVPAVAPANSNDTETSFVRVEAGRLSTLLDLLAELVSLRNRRDTYVSGLRDLHAGVSGCVSRMRTLTERLSDGASIAGEESQDFARSASRHATYRARELAELCSDVAELNRSLREVFDPLGNDNVAVSRLIGEFRRELMDLQRVPVEGLFRRLHRPTRDAARLEGKQVEVEFIGGEVRLERSLQERLFEPLMHIVRNAVSHGIEHPIGREQVNKAKVGRVTLSAHSNATSLVFEVRDDGRGLDYEKLEQKGRERGLILAGAAPSRDRLARLIFHPGFSTRSEVSEVSGRGVGMDVVATQVHRMRGRVEIDSETGHGTCIRLQIPLRSAIEHAMVMRCGGQLFAVPMQFVQAARPEASDLPPDLPTASLGRMLGLPDKVASQRRQLLVLGHHTGGPAIAANRVAIEVDSVVGAEEVVVRGVPPLLVGNPLLAGLTLSGHGETVQILDVYRLMQLATSEVTRIARPQQEMATDSVRQRAHILVVDDSLSTRRTHVRIARQAGYETSEASDGLEALNMLKTGDFDAVLTDLEMPRLGGFELVSEIKQRSRIKDMPVFVITSRGDEDTHRRLLSLGADQVVVKPLTNVIFDELDGMLAGTTEPVAVS